MIRKALVYVKFQLEHPYQASKQWLFFTLDNMPSECAVRSFTIKRKSTLFFNSDDGIESALKYHTLIEICKNVGLNVKEYLTYVFSKRIEGEKDYEKLLPSTVAR